MARGPPGSIATGAGADGTVVAARQDRESMARLFRLVVGLGVTAAVLVGLGLGAGFFIFLRNLDRAEQRAPASVDGIVALTGGSERIADAVDLLAHGRGSRLLITGVNEK